MTESAGGKDLGSGPKYMAKADMERKLPKRFYKDVTAKAEGNGFIIQLDGRTVKTPVKDDLVLPTKQLADTVVKEWEAQEEYIDPESMLVTKLANTALDRVRGRQDEIIEEIVSYLASDLLCYRSDAPQELVERQEKSWNPILEILERELGILLKTSSGIIHVTQADSSLEKARTHLAEYDIYALSGLHNMTTLLGSAALTIVWAKGGINSEEAWTAANLDEEWQTEKWGSDDEAEARQKARHEMFLAISSYFTQIQS